MMRFAIRVERRLRPPRALQVAAPIAAVALGFAAGAMVLSLGGHDPVDAYSSMWDASFGSPDGIASILIKATPLILTGLAVATALRMGLWNIGGEGQLIMGAVAATGVGLFVKGLPVPLLGVAMFAAALVGGAAWAAIAAIPRALLGVNEIITTLFLNYIALLLMKSLVFGPWGDPAAFGFAYSRPLPSGVVLPELFGSGVHAGILIALAAVGLAWWLVERTRWGFSIRIAGGNAKAAQYLRIPLRRRIIVMLALSGALAGLAGAIELTGVTHRLQEGISVNYGYSGVLIAFLARRRPLLVVLAALLFAALIVGSYALEVIGVAQPVATIIQAIIIVFLLAGDFLLAYRIHVVRRPSSGIADYIPAAAPAAER